MLIIFGKKDTKAYEYNAIVFMLSFFLCRIVLNTIMIYYVSYAVITTLTLNTVNLIYSYYAQIFEVPLWQWLFGGYFVLIFIAHYSLNAFWFSKMFKYLKKYMKSGIEVEQEEAMMNSNS